jgi:signal transduction histidine kinase
LRLTLQIGHAQPELASLGGSPERRETTDLQWRMDLINKLQAELGALYAIRQNLLESMHEGLAVFAQSGETLFRNQYWDQFCRKQGWNPEMNLQEFGQLLGHPRWLNVQARLQETRQPLESEIHLKGGFWQVRGVPLPRTSGGPGSKWMIVVTDLTSTLERDQARAEALRFVTHELRTPLVSIQGFAEFLLRYPQASGSPNAAATIFRESQRLVSLINTYLDVLRFDAGARSLRRVPISISQMIAQLQQVMSPIAEAAEIRIRVQENSDLPILEGDAPMLTGVLLNLLNNAVKYSPSGSEVTLEVTGTNSSVFFEVSNPGSPIPAEEMARLFEPFYRAPAAADSAPGWGLGLTFVKRIVEEHRGDLEAFSDERGIRVRVTLPAGRIPSLPDVDVQQLGPKDSTG